MIELAKAAAAARAEEREARDLAWQAALSESASAELKAQASAALKAAVAKREAAEAAAAEAAPKKIAK